MKTIQLNISRDKAFVGTAMPYRVYINNQEVGKIKIGSTITLEISDQPTTIKVSMVGNVLNFHPIEKEVVLFPEKSKSGIIDCLITTKPIWAGILTYGFLQAVGRAELILNYK